MTRNRGDFGHDSATDRMREGIGLAGRLPRPHALDPDAAKRLGTISEQPVGRRFPLRPRAAGAGR